MRRYRILELGRSMVEMLGVLAIIGLLSIIGIQGYKKAMNRAKANELMDLAMKLHHENLAYAVTQRKPETYPECKLFMRTTSDLTTTEKRRAEWEVPSWVDNPKFNIQVSYCASVKASSGSPYQRQTYYLMMFYHMNKDICQEIKKMTQDGSGAYRLLTTASDSLPIHVYCSSGYSTSEATALW